MPEIDWYNAISREQVIEAPMSTHCFQERASSTEATPFMSLRWIAIDTAVYADQKCQVLLQAFHVQNFIQRYVIVMPLCCH